MNISKKQRSWLLGGTLALTVAATAAVNSRDNGDLADVREISRPRKPVANETLQQETNQHETSRSPEKLPDLSEPQGSLLEKLKRPAMPESMKDMFQAKSWYVPPPPPARKGKGGATGMENVPIPVAPPLPFQYIGKMKGDGNRSAVFLENQGRIFIAGEGDTVESKYRVDTIIPPVMTLTYLPLNIKQTMQIGETN